MNVRRQTCSRVSCYVVAWLLTGVSLTQISQFACGADWPQILGPQRDGNATEEKLTDRWPSGGPRASWTHALGQGYAGPAVVGDRVIIFHRSGNFDTVEAIDARTGKPVWQRDYRATYGGGINSDSGPRCVPLVHEGRIYVFGANGDLHCLALKDGSRVWTRQTYVDYRGDEGYFGAGATPIAIGKHLIVNVGGRQDGGIVAFQLATGKTAWEVSGEKASYSSPTVATIDRRAYAIFVTRLNAVGVDAETGKLLFRFPYGQRGPTVNAATPLVFDNNKLFLSSSYGVGANLSQLSKAGAKPIWANDETLSSQYTTAVYHKGFLYGTHGREDVGSVELRCVHAATGSVKWKVATPSVSHVLLADNKLLLLGVDGRLLLAKATPEQYRPLSEATVSKGSTRAIPALSGGKLYLRDNAGNGGTLRCFDVGG